MKLVRFGQRQGVRLVRNSSARLRTFIVSVLTGDQAGVLRAELSGAAGVPLRFGVWNGCSERPLVWLGDVGEGAGAWAGANLAGGECATAGGADGLEFEGQQPRTIKP